MPPNATSRLRFREMSTDDLDEMADLLGDPRVMEYYPHPKNRTEAAGWIDWNVRNYAEYCHGLWVIETHAGEFIGDCGLTWQKVDDTRGLELGYHVKSSAQKFGYATEAAIACRDYAGSHALASRLVSIIHQDNRSSQRVAEKVGMRLDRSLRHASPVHLVFTMEL
ncbi:GNAT family N-acetyltransferase [Brevibacterium sp. UCMA 11754]|uniref:GNAT family N-acetyltransferase n=1 Tax=Brevibacterium sp. UCMA 11754 TaxID=2749198 RepID=UPI002285F551|nr:GNAT family N-acetyltransferase [Brevibacterium sp. UCMA 11754]MCF2572452.1 GNAT family N-acetyltransferase [Brevibacterium sp. UCMA 11754]